MPACLQPSPDRQNQNIRRVPGPFAVVGVQRNIDLRFEREIGDYTPTLGSNLNPPERGTLRREISQKRLIANRRNSLRSTGPRTARGKAASRKNALRHGLLSSTLGVPPDAADAFNSALSSLGETEALTLQEKQMLERITQTWWKLAEIVTLDNHSISQRSDALKLAPRLILRYESTLARQLRARIREFAARRSETRGWA